MRKLLSKLLNSLLSLCSKMADKCGLYLPTQEPDTSDQLSTLLGLCSLEGLTSVRFASGQGLCLAERFGLLALDATAQERLKLSATKTSRVRLSVPKWLAAKTFRVEYSPNCANPWLVRLVGYGRGCIDGRPYAPMGLCNEAPTQDALGFGHSFAAAANNALKHYENQKRLSKE